MNFLLACFQINSAHSFHSLIISKHWTSKNSRVSNNGVETLDNDRFPINHLKVVIRFGPLHMQLSGGGCAPGRRHNVNRRKRM
jgi:hypothetical protein